MGQGANRILLLRKQLRERGCVWLLPKSVREFGKRGWRWSRRQNVGEECKLQESEDTMEMNESDESSAVGVEEEEFS